MLKAEIEVKDLGKKACLVHASLDGKGTRDEAVAMAEAMGKLFAELHKAAPKLSGKLYDSFADALKKQLGVDEE